MVVSRTLEALKEPAKRKSVQIQPPLSQGEDNDDASTISHFRRSKKKVSYVEPLDFIVQEDDSKEGRKKEEEEEEMEKAPEEMRKRKEKEGGGWHESPLEAAESVFSCECCMGKNKGDAGRCRLREEVRTYGKKRLAAAGDGEGDVTNTVAEKTGWEEQQQENDAGKKKKRKRTAKKTAAKKTATKKADADRESLVRKSLVFEMESESDEPEQLRGREAAAAAAAAEEEEEELILSEAGGDASMAAPPATAGQSGTAPVEATGDGDESAAKKRRLEVTAANNSPLAESTRCDQPQPPPLAAGGDGGGDGGDGARKMRAADKRTRLEQELVRNVVSTITSVDGEEVGQRQQQPETPRTTMHQTPQLLKCRQLRGGQQQPEQLQQPSVSAYELRTPENSDKENATPPPAVAAFSLARHPRVVSAVAVALQVELEDFSTRVGRRITEAVLRLLG